MMQHPLHIAIADDEPDMRDFLRKILTRWGHHVTCAAENGQQLIAGCAADPPALIITDLKMPEVDGIAAITAIWRDRAVPVIVISAYPQDIPEWLQQHPQLASVLIKPVRTSDLEPVVARVADAVSASS